MRQRVTINGRSYLRFIVYPAPINDGTARCIACGQIDDEPWHDPAICKASRATSGMTPGQVDECIGKLGKRQREVVLSLTPEWGPASSHQAAKRLWYSMRLIDHRHQTDNCWCLTSLGEQVKAELIARRDAEQDLAA